jgi:hypothetical protein
MLFAAIAFSGAVWKTGIAVFPINSNVYRDESRIDPFVPAAARPVRGTQTFSDARFSRQELIRLMGIALEWTSSGEMVREGPASTQRFLGLILQTSLRT